MQTQTLQVGAESFKVSVHEAATISFRGGSGWSSRGRHATLLGALAESGCTVVAPHFERLASPVPSEADLTLRARRLSLALDAFVQPGTTAVGVSGQKFTRLPPATIFHLDTFLISLPPLLTPL
jgi:hypothetical protein